MAKLHFFYSTMNAGKSTSLLQVNHNYKEKNNKTLLFLPEVAYKSNKGKIKSRIGLHAKAICITDKYNFRLIKNLDDISCIFVDEAQFLKKKHIKELSRIVDKKNINVMCYGIRTDFKGNLFSGSKALLALADNIIEIKTVCRFCEKKAIMVKRIDNKGNVIKSGKQILIGGNEIYESVCRKHFFYKD
tara:strand:+ start:332 stop:895 length:564 start_codon:yes stop_codon:yes gene_type:complete